MVTDVAYVMTERKGLSGKLKVFWAKIHFEKVSEKYPKSENRFMIMEGNATNLVEYISH